MKTEKEIQIKINMSKTACERGIDTLSGDDQMYERGFRAALREVLEENQE